MRYKFVVRVVEVNGTVHQRAYSESASSFNVALSRSLTAIKRELPGTKFQGLSYFGFDVEEPLNSE
jgi:hypothetical protein